MLDGELYLATDSELVAESNRAKHLTRLYNATTEQELERRKQILQELFGTVGANTNIQPPFYCDYGSNIHAGDGL